MYRVPGLTRTIPYTPKRHMLICTLASPLTACAITVSDLATLNLDSLEQPAYSNLCSPQNPPLYSRSQKTRAYRTRRPRLTGG
jgi:hypothetical protein